MQAAEAPGNPADTDGVHGRTGSPGRAKKLKEKMELGHILGAK
jgi:hypothetical protein